MRPIIIFFRESKRKIINVVNAYKTQMKPLSLTVPGEQHFVLKLSDKITQQEYFKTLTQDLRVSSKP